MKSTPLPIVLVRTIIVLAIIGTGLHLIKCPVAYSLYYKVSGWSISGLMLLAFGLSWVRKPSSALYIAFLLPIIPTAYLTLLWLIVLRTSQIWEFVIVGFGILILPIILSFQIVKGESARRYFRFPIA